MWYIWKKLSIFVERIDNYTESFIQWCREPWLKWSALTSTSLACISQAPLMLGNLQSLTFLSTILAAGFTSLAALKDHQELLLTCDFKIKQLSDTIPSLLRAAEKNQNHASAKLFKSLAHDVKMADNNRHKAREKLYWAINIQYLAFLLSLSDVVLLSVCGKNCFDCASENASRAWKLSLHYFILTVVCVITEVSHLHYHGFFSERLNSTNCIEHTVEYYENKLIAAEASHHNNGAQNV
jgi:hypothetical protein